MPGADGPAKNFCAGSALDIGAITDSTDPTLGLWACAEAEARKRADMMINCAWHASISMTEGWSCGKVWYVVQVTLNARTSE